MSPILLFSGGIDSYVAWYFLGKPRTVYFYLNSRYSEKEARVVKHLIPSTIFDYSLDFSSREKGEKAYIPFRNLVLACQAVKYSDRVVIAGVKDDRVSDKNKGAFLSFSKLLSKLEGRKISVESPFWGMTKERVVQWFLKNGGTREDILRTVSCYDPDPKVTYCGRCPSCFRKWNALMANGIVLPFYSKTLIQAYVKAARQGIYDKERNRSILKVCS